MSLRWVFRPSSLPRSEWSYNNIYIFCFFFVDFIFLPSRLTIAQWLLCDESASLTARLGHWQELYTSVRERTQQYLLPGKLSRGLCIEMIQTGHQHEYVTQGRARYFPHTSCDVY